MDVARYPQSANNHKQAKNRTHQHLFQKEEPEICNDCNKRIIVEHIITECHKYQKEKKKEINIKFQLALKNNNEATKNIEYLQDTKLYKQINSY